jgi:hypothetical protein
MYFESERRRNRDGTADGIRWRQMTGHGTKFGRKQEEAIAALLSKTRIEDAAGVVGERC